MHAVMAIEDACGISPRAYRAPSFSITSQSMWALEILAENGFTHDSSIYPIVHDRYGIPGFARHAQTLYTKSGPIFEVPVATARLLHRRSLRSAAAHTCGSFRTAILLRVYGG